MFYLAKVAIHTKKMSSNKKKIREWELGNLEKDLWLYYFAFCEHVHLK